MLGLGMKLPVASVCIPTNFVPVGNDTVVAVDPLEN